MITHPEVLYTFALSPTNHINEVMQIFPFNGGMLKPYYDYKSIFDFR